MHTRPWSCLALLMALVAACGGDSGGTGPDGNGDGSGAIRISTATTGSAVDQDGYTLALDGGTAEPIGASATLVLPDLAVGSHVVTLEGLAPPCTVDGEPIRTVTVSGGDTTSVAFSVTCTASTGSLTVSVASTGAPADPDGYQVSIDGAAPVAVSDAQPFTQSDLTPGSHTAMLTDVAGNCSVEGDSTATAAVSVGAGATIDFAVTCADPGRLAYLRFGELLSAAPDGSDEQTVLSSSDYSVLDPAWSPDGSELAYVAWDNAFDFVLAVTSADGSNSRTLVPSGSGYLRHPAWSPDGDRVALLMPTGVPERSDALPIVAVDAGDGANKTVMSGDPFGTFPAWSPDGSMIAYHAPDGIHLVETATREHDRAVTFDPTDAPLDWSPDGKRLLFARSVDGEAGPSHLQIFVLDVADPSSARQLTDDDTDSRAPDAAWSPNGRQIAYCVGSVIRIMHGDGSDPAVVPVTTAGPADPPVEPLCGMDWGR